MPCTSPTPDWACPAHASALNSNHSGLKPNGKAHARRMTSASASRNSGVASGERNPSNACAAQSPQPARSRSSGTSLASSGQLTTASGRADELIRISFLPPCDSTITGEASAPLPQIDGMATSLSPARRSRTAFAWSMSVPPPTTTSHCASASNGCAESDGGHGKTAATRACADGVAQRTTPVVAFCRSWSRDHWAGRSMVKVDAFG